MIFPEYIPALRPVGSTLTVIDPGALPEFGLMESHLPPVGVLTTAFAVHCSVPPPVFRISIVFEAGLFVEVVGAAPLGGVVVAIRVGSIVKFSACGVMTSFAG